MFNLKLRIIILSILCSPLFVWAQNPDVAIIAYWEKGANYKFKIRKSQEKWEETKTTKKESDGYIANLKVIDSTESSYKLEWSFLKDETLESESIVSFFDLIPNIIYTTDQNGIFKEIINWKEISNILEGYYQSLMKGSKADLTKDQLQSMNEIFQSVYSQQGIQEVIMKELQLFHLPFGYLFEKGAPIEYEEKLSNFMGGEPMAGAGKISFKYLDEEAKRGLITQTLTIPSNEVNKLLKGLVEKLKLTDKELDEAMKNWNYDFKDDNSFELNLKTGVPIKFIANRTIILKMKDQQVKKQDIIEITRIDE